MCTSGDISERVVRTCRKYETGPHTDLLCSKKIDVNAVGNAGFRRSAVVDSGVSPGEANSTSLVKIPAVVPPEKYLGA